MTPMSSFPRFAKFSERSHEVFIPMALGIGSNRVILDVGGNRLGDLEIDGILGDINETAFHGHARADAG